MSDTPRTEAEINRQKCWSEDLITIDADFCRQLERELNAANAEIEEKRKDVVWLATEKAKLENHVMRLESVENIHSDVLKAIDNWVKQHKSNGGRP